MAIVDREMAALGEERAEKSKRLNLKRMQHVSTLQQLSKFFLVFFFRALMFSLVFLCV